MPYDSLGEIVKEAAEKSPDRPALTDGKTSLTYGQLWQQGCAVAGALLRRGLAGHNLAILTDKETAYGPLLLACALTASPASPFEVNLPAGRLGKMAKKIAPAAILLTREELRQGAEKWAGATTMLTLEELLADGGAAGKLPLVSPQNTFMLLFTSGSTGTPKAVEITHRAVLFISLYFGRQIFRDAVNFGALPPFSFVGSLPCLWGIWSVGGTVHLLPAHFFTFPPLFVKYLQENQVDSALLVPSVMEFVVRAGVLKADLPLRRLAYAGSPLAPVALRQWQEALPQASFWQLYGMTETASCALCYEIPRPFEGEKIPLGEPLKGMGLQLLDEDGMPVPKEAGQRGQICLRGPNLAEGYYGDGPLPMAGVFFATGDYAAYDRAGNLCYAGRQDEIVKLRGCRTELGDISAAALEAGGQEAAVLYEEGELVLFYVGSVGQQEMARCLEESLPAYMQPQRLIRLEKLPHTLSGKVDKPALRELLGPKD